MRIRYDPKVDALTIPLVDERVECEVIRLSDQVAIDPFGGAKPRL